MTVFVYSLCGHHLQAVRNQPLNIVCLYIVYVALICLTQTINSHLLAPIIYFLLFQINAR